MSVKKSYVCDLCGVTKGFAHLKGVIWGKTSLSLVKKAEDVEGKHICIECLKALCSEFEKLGLKNHRI